MKKNKDNGKIIIFLNRYKTFLWALGCLGFAIVIALGCWIAKDQTLSEVGAYTFAAGRGLLAVGPFAIIFFSIGAILIFIKTFNPKPALIINKSGIWDNSTFFGWGLVKWEEITGFSHLKVQWMKFIELKVKNPEEIILRRHNSIERFLMKLDNEWFGSPTHINVSGLNYDADKLYRILEECLKKSRNK